MSITLAKARFLIYVIWAIALFAYLGMFELAPIIRKGIINDAQAHAGLMRILFLVIPVLGAFSAYWFGPGRKAVNGTVSAERWKPALISTLLYHVILGFKLWVVIYHHDYRGSENGVGANDSSFEDLVGNAFQLGVILSFLATAPAAFLVGADRIEVPEPK